MPRCPTGPSRNPGGVTPGPDPRRDRRRWPHPAPRPPHEFERVVIDADFPGAYQVEVADVDGDGRLDVVAVGGGTCAWYENPSWKKRVVSTPEQTPGIISSATADLDGDGKAEVAIAYEFAMNEPKKGKLLLAIQGKGRDDPWTLTPVADVGSIHRLRWGHIIGTPRVLPGAVALDKKLELVVAPIFGPSARPPVFDQEPAHLLVFNTGSDPKSGRWSPTIIGHAPVLHAIDLLDIDGRHAVLGASNLGVTSSPTGRDRPGRPHFPPNSSPRARRERPPRRGRARSTSAGSRTVGGSSPRSSPGTAPTSPSTCPSR